jgi:transcriptional regulator GlxA family with amidase domain
MKSVSILLLDYVNIAGMENIRQGFLEANKYLQMHGKPPKFKVELVGNGHPVQIDDGLYAIRPQRSIEQIEQTDLIIIPPLCMDNVFEAIKQNQKYLPWLVEQKKNGAEVASLCLGAFVLGASGLVKNKSCVTHWQAADDFKKHFPDVRLMEDKIITDEDGIYTGGGAFSSANLILYLIEKMIDRETAIYCSKHFQIDMGRDSQSPFVIFRGQKSHGDEMVLKAQLSLEHNFSGELTVTDLARQLCVGKRTLERRFKIATGNTMSAYLQRVRIEVAKRKFEEGHYAIKEVMYQVGYADAKFFSSLFKRYVGLNPAEYKLRYA